MVSVIGKIWNLDQFLIEKDLIDAIVFASHSVAAILSALKEASSNSFLTAIIGNISSAVRCSELAMNVAVANVVFRIVDALIQRKKLAFTEGVGVVICLVVVSASLNIGSR